MFINRIKKNNNLSLWLQSIHSLDSCSVILLRLPSGKHTKNYGKTPFLMGKLTICMAIFNSFLYVITRGYFVGQARNPKVCRWDWLHLATIAGPRVSVVARTRRCSTSAQCWNRSPSSTGAGAFSTENPPV